MNLFAAKGMMRWVLILFFCSIHCDLQAKPPLKKYNLSVCAIFKNEADHLKEWIEYHRIIGVDHFYLYENGSSDRFMKILRPYINKKIVTLIRWPDLVKRENNPEPFLWPLTTQVPAYENALHLYAKKETKWLVFLDISEFLISVNENSLIPILDAYQDSPGITISSDCFDASTIHCSSSRQLVIESEELTQTPPCNLEESIKKIIFKPEECVAFFWPPYQCLFKENRQPITLNRNTLRINNYTNRNSKQLCFRKKIRLDLRNISEQEISNILNSGYNIEDSEKPIHRFIPKLLFSLQDK